MRQPGDDFRKEWDLEHCWTEPGPRGMATKDRKDFVPYRYVRKWKESNEERIKNALERFKSLRLRIKFELEEHIDDVNNRLGKPINRDAPWKKKWVPIVGATITVRKIPSAGMLWQFVNACQTALKELARTK